MTDYAQQWKRFKWLRNAWVFLLVAVFLGMNAVIARVIRIAIPSMAPGFAAVIAEFLWLVTIALIALELRNWKCPACGKPFAGGHKTRDHVKTYFNWLFLPKQCVSCGLPKYSIDPAAAPSAVQSSPPQES